MHKPRRRRQEWPRRRPRSRLAQITREHAEIRAPFDGVVAQVNIDPGDRSTTGGQPAIKVVDISALHLDAQISDIDIGQVAVGQAAEVRADAQPDTVYKGKVSYIAPTATTFGTIRTFLVRVALDEQEGLLAGIARAWISRPNNDLSAQTSDYYET